MYNNHYGKQQAHFKVTLCQEVAMISRMWSQTYNTTDN